LRLSMLATHLFPNEGFHPNILWDRFSFTRCLLHNTGHVMIKERLMIWRFPVNHVIGWQAYFIRRKSFCVCVCLWDVRSSSFKAYLRAYTLDTRKTTSISINNIYRELKRRLWKKMFWENVQNLYLLLMPMSINCMCHCCWNAES
jgi:hypothetical protein